MNDIQKMILEASYAVSDEMGFGRKKNILDVDLQNEID